MYQCGNTLVAKAIVILANSYKRGGRCVAGREILFDGDKVPRVGRWIRPITVSELEREGLCEGGQVTEASMRLALKRADLPVIGEIIEIPLSGPAASPGQPENWALETGQPWKHLGRLSSPLFDKLLDNPKEIWDTSGCGRAAVADSIPKPPGFASLFFLRRDRAVAKVGSRPKSGGLPGELTRSKILVFDYAGQRHEFRISDPMFDAKYEKQFPALGAPEKTFALPKGTYVTVSLTPPYSPTGQPPFYHYKMAAAIIELGDLRA